MRVTEKVVRSAADLADARLIAREKLPDIARVAARYAVAITPAVADLIAHGDAADPIARQFVPDAGELVMQADEHPDPIGDAAHEAVEGVVHRYPDRVLLKLTQTCAAYCRFCFRRETVGSPTALSRRALTGALNYIAERPDIWEVILSGGDPLVLSDRRLREVAGRLATINHVKILRVHTRVPVVAPERITPALVRALKAAGKATYVVLHANHPRELSDAARAACARLIDTGIPMLGQTVLLRGVNDDAQILGDLMRAFVECRIKPYYLHHCDLAPGTAHFRITIAEGQELMRALRGRTSGLCQPTYVLDIPGGYGKSPIGPSYLREAEQARHYVVEDYCGCRHAYPPT